LVGNHSIEVPKEERLLFVSLVGRFGSDSPRTRSGDGFSPPNPFGLWRFVSFFVFLSFLCLFGRKSLNRGSKGGKAVVCVIGGKIW
jgi:hypothetical protein